MKNVFSNSLGISLDMNFTIMMQILADYKDTITMYNMGLRLVNMRQREDRSCH